MKSFLSDEERVRLLEANVTDYAIFMIDTDERIAIWNSGAERILGYADSDIIGQPASIIFTHEDRESGAEQSEFLTARETSRAVISLPVLLEKLLLLLQSIVGRSRIERQLDEVYVSTRMGSSIALIMNELVTNAVHYGNGSIRITLSAVEGNAVL